MQIRIGTCGWSFDDWRGPFYPPGDTDQLVHYATQFSAVEVDSTWYHMPSERNVDSWYRRTPDDFTFCPKMTGEITHENMLEKSDHLAVQFVDTVARMGEKLGCAVVQLSPRFKVERFDALSAFLRNLPTTTRYAVEFRHKSWEDHAEALGLLRELNMGCVMADHPWYPRMPHATSDFAYIRLLGRRDVFPDYAKVYLPRDSAIAEWAETLRALSSDLERAYVFVNNQFEGHSPATVRKLVALLDEDLEVIVPEPPPNEDAQQRLFD